jgi:translation initiation factor 2 beta subunit (eIF-2beta)/eIF-5
MSWYDDDPCCKECGSREITLIGVDHRWSGLVANECQCKECGSVFTDPEMEMV